jgi:glutathione synthase/RimK-type ligase-like ATP-grasp enzyme
MILIVTNRGDLTADFGILEMQRRGVQYARFNTEDYPQHSTITVRFTSSGIDGWIDTAKGKVPLDEVGSVWFRRPVEPVPSPELEDPTARQFCHAESLALLEALWRTLDCFWVSKPDRIRAAESKLLQLSIASEVGLPIPRTLVTSDANEARLFFEECSETVYKPLRLGRIEHPEGTSLIFTTVVTRAHAAELENVRYAPCLFQQHVPKAMDIRVTVFGDHLYATEIHSQVDPQSAVDWRRGGSLALAYHPHTLPEGIKRMCMQLVERLDLSFGAIDLILTPQGDYVFLEINPNGQWAWIEQRTGASMSQSLVDLLLEGRK